MPSSFEVWLQNPSGNAAQPDTVHCLVVEEGAWVIDGVKLEAFTYTSTVTDGAGRWFAQARGYGHSYEVPVVLGQVMTENDPGWSVFWSRGALYNDPPSPATIRTGKHVGQDPRTAGLAESIYWHINCH